jgi:hypothetical protein
MGQKSEKKQSARRTTTTMTSTSMEAPMTLAAATAPTIRLQCPMMVHQRKYTVSARVWFRGCVFVCLLFRALIELHTAHMTDDRDGAKVMADAH